MYVFTFVAILKTNRFGGQSGMSRLVHHSERNELTLFVIILQFVVKLNYHSRLTGIVIPFV